MRPSWAGPDPFSRLWRLSMDKRTKLAAKRQHRSAPAVPETHPTFRTAPTGGGLPRALDGLRDTAVVSRAKAVQIDSRNKTQLYIITRLCGQNLVASQRVLSELQQLLAQEL